MVTLSKSGGVASIGLIAVALMHAACQWMRSRGAREARMVGQSATLPACRLDERSGCRLSQLQHYYHLCPLPGSHGP